MPTKLSDIKTLKDKYEAIIVDELRKLKSGYGMTIDEMAGKCGLKAGQFRDYGFVKKFASHIKVINQTKYFVK